MSGLISKAEVLSLLDSLMETYWDRKQILSIARNSIEKLPAEERVINFGEIANVKSMTMIENVAWISTSERLPIEFLDRRILVSTVSPTGRKSVDIGLWEGGKWTTYFPIGDDRVTAWMPLPSPYAGDGD